MSQGATEQAAATEEVSSSMEQMAANIRQNTDNALMTEKLAMHAVESAQQGGDAALEAVTAMRKIAEKISIIEEIARQTNMLSLNATIEAAKANEKGKGFAVVASEVRTLAGRSREAAEAINSLAGSGVEIAEQAGELLVQLVPDIQKTAELMQEISAASREQDAGAEQINQAIQQLDQTTQQNAANSEEIAAMAEELATQAEQLRDTIAFFKLAEVPHTSQDENKTLLDMIYAVADTETREQLLVAIVKLLAAQKDAPEILLLSETSNDSSNKKQSASDEPVIDPGQNKEGRDARDDEFERF
jgi:methyl-accepting chemotaxis protein